jgi:hypothetical protein
MALHPEDLVAVPPALGRLRRFALDGALLLFDRRTGLTAICDGEETAALRMRAPRVVQFSITNACNLACSFCSRDLAARSAWTADEVFAILRDLDAAGTLEVAFGGGEPLVFKGFVNLVKRLDRETGLAVSLTTNGTRLSPEVAVALAPHVGQIRLSVYDDVDPEPALAALVASRARFGVNWLVTPARLPGWRPRSSPWRRAAAATSCSFPTTAGIGRCTSALPRPARSPSGLACSAGRSAAGSRSSSTSAGASGWRRCPQSCAVPARRVASSSLVTVYGAWSSTWMPVASTVGGSPCSGQSSRRPGRSSLRALVRAQASSGDSPPSLQACSAAQRSCSAQTSRSSAATSSASRAERKVPTMV